MKHFRHAYRLCVILLILLRHDVFCVRKKGLRKGERLAKALERLGPTFIKLGQAISTRSDIIGDDVADDLAMLRDKLPPFPAHVARGIVEAEFQRKIDDMFLAFDDVAVAAASIAQVHKATTKDGKIVAVKVLRPHIEKAFARDIELFFWIADIVQRKLPEYRRLKAREIVQTFKETVFLELDLRFEAAAAEELAKNVALHPTGMHVPEVLWEFTSHRVLTAAWVDGISFNDMESIRASGFDQDKLLEKAANSLFSQIFIDGFFHADLHPGNLFLDTKTGDLVAVDFGIMGRLDWQSRAYIAQIIHGFLNEDYASVAKLHFAAGYVPSHKSLEAFTQACMAVARPILGKPLNEISVAALLGQMFKIAAEFEMETQPQLLLMQKTLMVAEGLGRMLNPNLNMWELSRPMIEQWANEHFSHTARAKMALQHAHQYAMRLPYILEGIERTLKVLSDENGLKLHPKAILAFQESRRKNNTQWMLLACAGLILLATIAFG
jgi:ubiquinone biosynthesis protein